MPIDFSDATVDWANMLPPHIAEERRRAAEARQAAEEARGGGPPHPVISSGFGSGNVQIFAPARRRTEGAVSAAEPQGFGRAQGSPATSRHQPPVSLSPQGPRAGSVSHSSGEVVTARAVGNSRAALIAARERQAVDDFHASPSRAVNTTSSPQPNPIPQPSVAAHDRRRAEVDDQNDRVRRQILERTAAHRAVETARREAHQAALRAQENEVRTAMLQRQAPAPQRPAGRTPYDELVRAQLAAEEADRRGLREAMATVAPSWQQVAAPRTDSGQSESAARAHAPAVPAPVVPAPTVPVVRAPDAAHVQPQHAPELDTPQRYRHLVDQVTWGGARRGAARGRTSHFGASAAIPQDAFRARPLAGGGGGGAGNGTGIDGGGGWELTDFSYEALLELGSMAVSTGLSQKQLQRYAPFAMSDAHRPRGSTAHEECAICLEALADGERCLGIQCGHVFHHPCILQWLMRTNKCPICRFDIPRRE